ncbi:uncharacterized protein LOC135395454 [Ornithodoros turicata]|uniref:uncharacterized protein LOC135395454 n=1 Tax=Ornithodoros turicata TaxID=34597 RepID=UPI0031386999
MRRHLPCLHPKVALVGDAARWLLLQSRFTSLQDLKQRFKNEFLLPDYDYEYRVVEELHKRTQHSDDTLAEFVRALQDLYSRAEPTATEQQQVARAIRQYHPRFRPYLRAHRFDSPEALAQVARTYHRGRPPGRTRISARRISAAPELALEPRCACSAGSASVERLPAVGQDEHHRYPLRCHPAEQLIPSVMDRGRSPQERVMTDPTCLIIVVNPATQLAKPLTGSGNDSVCCARSREGPPAVRIALAPNIFVGTARTEGRIPVMCQRETAAADVHERSLNDVGYLPKERTNGRKQRTSSCKSWL